MHDGRDAEAYCATCGDVRRHRIEDADPGSCRCVVCGAVQQLMVPVD